MATTEELEKEILAEMAADPVAYAAGPVNDVITIDGETRVISVPASELLFGVETDKDVERKHFMCPKIVGDGIDLSKHQIYISYITSDSTGKSFSGDSNLYLCEDVAVDGDDITFSWQLSGNVFASAGFIAFKVLAAKTDGENVQTRWNTVPAVGTVLMTVPDGMDISETYPDIVTQLLERMSNVEKIATEEAMQGYVNTYLEAHPAEIDETLTNPKKAAPASVVGELKEDLYDLVLKTKRNPLQLFNVNKVTEGRLKNDGTVDNNILYVTNRYEDISDFVGYYFASIGNDTPCAFYDEGGKLVQYFTDSRYYRNQIVPANSKYFKVSTAKSSANTFCFSVSNNKFNTVPTYNDYIVEKTELNPMVSIPTKQDRNVGADNKGKILMVDDDGNIVCKDYLEKESKIIEYWGDSLTEGNQDNSGVTRATVLSSLVGSEWTVINNNDGGGEKSNTISCKACGTGIIAEPFTIPSSTDKVEVVLKDDIGYDCNFRRSSNMAESTLNPCIINGITGIIFPGPVYGQNPYKFQRNESGNEVVLKRPIGVISSSAKKQKGSVLIICIGQNTGWNNDGSLLVKQVKGIIEYYKSTRFLVIGIPHSKRNSWQIAGNDALKLEFGRHYIDVEEYMKTPIYDADGATIISSYALDDCNLTPTSEDIVNIGQNKYPTQIMSDSTHFNRYGYTIWANLEYQRGKELGYWN